MNPDLTERQFFRNDGACNPIGIGKYGLHRLFGKSKLAATMLLACCMVMMTGSYRTAAQPLSGNQTSVVWQTAQLAESGNPDTPAKASQTNSQSSGPSIPDDAATKIESWNRVLDNLLRATGRDGAGDEELANLAAQADELRRDAAALIASQAPLYRQLSEQLEQLGPPPGENDPPESEEIARRRAQLNDQLTAIDGIQRESRLVMLRVNQLESAALAQRRERFVRSLTVRSFSVLDPQLWLKSAEGVGEYLRSLKLQVTESLSFAAGQIVARPLAQIWMLAQIVLAIAIYFLLRRWLGAVERRSLPPPSPKGISEPWTAASKLRWLVANGILPAALLFVVQWIVNDAELLPGRFMALAGNLIAGLSAAFVAIAVLTLFVSPLHREKRIAPISDAAAKNIQSYGVFTIFAILAVSTLNFSAVQLLAPFETSIALSAVMTILFLSGAAYTMWRVASDFGQADSVAKGAPHVHWRAVTPIVWLGCAISFIGLLTGHIALSEFIAYQILFALVIAAILWLVLRLIDQTKTRLMTGHGKSFSLFGFPAATSRQLAVLIFGAARVIAVITAVFALLLPWGIRSQDWLSLVRRAFFGFQLGDLTISVSSIMVALVTFVIGLVATRHITRWVSRQYLPATRLDAGLRNSITTVLGYLGIVITALLAITAAGLDLSKVALVAGALSVGIGFGLQSIVNNFLSGLILLAERPIKTGDWIITSGGQGIVGKISVRSTEIETFDGATVIVPNSTMITEAVTNWTHRNTRGRIIVNVGVAYDSDPVQVRELLLQCAKEHPLVLDQPEPQVYFLDFGSDALMFDLRAYLAEIGNTLVVSSDLRFAILRALREANIEIPFPQRDLHIKSGLLPYEKDPEEMAMSVGRQHRNTTTGALNEIEE